MAGNVLRETVFFHADDESGLQYVASAYGIPNRTVVEREDLAAAIREMVEAEGPYLLQVAVIEEGRVLPMCCPGNDVDDMVLDY